MHQERPRYGSSTVQPLSRRQFLASLLAISAASACSRSSAPSGAFAVMGSATTFPGDVPQYRSDFENWVGELHFTNLRACTPGSPDDVEALANWAAGNGFTLRPRGAMHNWSPLSLSFSTTAQTPLMLVDTQPHLNRMEMVAGPIPAVRVETGATLEALMTFIEGYGYGFTATPVLGNITIGGALTIDGHGCAVPALGEVGVAQQTYGTMSNRVLALTAVVWDPQLQRYALRQFERSDPQIGALLVGLGRAFITEVTLAVEPNQNLRCVSYVDIPASEMFAPPGAGAGRTLASFLDSGGRVEMLWYGFTENPWLKVWSVSPEQPLGSRMVTSPYNYPFTDSYPDEVAELAREAVTGTPQSGALIGPASYAITAAGLTALLATDLWGASKNLLIWLKPTTLRVHHFSYVAITSRAQAQQVVSDYTSKFLELRDIYSAQGKYPVNMPMEIRITGLDRPSDIGFAAAQPALLSAVTPCADHPEWDTAVWLSQATLPGTPDMYAFYREFELWMHQHYVGDYARLRAEWSKGWAYTNTAAWKDSTVLTQKIPQSFGANWQPAMQTLHALDPANIYSNDFVSMLLR